MFGDLSFVTELGQNELRYLLPNWFHDVHRCIICLSRSVSNTVTA